MSELLRLFGWPIALAATTFIGLMAALWGGPGWSWLSWLGLAAPLIVVASRLFRARRG